MFIEAMILASLLKFCSARTRTGFDDNWKVAGTIGNVVYRVLIVMLA